MDKLLIYGTVTVAKKALSQEYASFFEETSFYMSSFRGGMRIHPIDNVYYMGMLQRTKESNKKRKVKKKEGVSSAFQEKERHYFYDDE